MRNQEDLGWFNGDFNYDGTINGSDYTLIDNAFKHTDDGGRIQVRLDNGYQAARLMVLDDGPGIPADDLERVSRR